MSGANPAEVSRRWRLGRFSRRSSGDRAVVDHRGGPRGAGSGRPPRRRPDPARRHHHPLGAPGRPARAGRTRVRVRPPPEEADAGAPPSSPRIWMTTKTSRPALRPSSRARARTRARATRRIRPAARSPAAGTISSSRRSPTRAGWPCRSATCRPRSSTPRRRTRRRPSSPCHGTRPSASRSWTWRRWWTWPFNSCSSSWSPRRPCSTRAWKSPSPTLRAAMRRRPRQGRPRRLDDLMNDYILVEIDPAGAIRIDREPVAAAMPALVERLRAARERTGRQDDAAVGRLHHAAPQRRAGLRRRQRDRPGDRRRSTLGTRRGEVSGSWFVKRRRLLERLTTVGVQPRINESLDHGGHLGPIEQREAEPVALNRDCRRVRASSRGLRIGAADRFLKTFHHPWRSRNVLLNYNSLPSPGRAQPGRRVHHERR